jgi:hypothetical protein
MNVALETGVLYGLEGEGEVVLGRDVWTAEGNGGREGEVDEEDAGGYKGEKGKTKEGTATLLLAWLEGGHYV